MSYDLITVFTSVPVVLLLAATSPAFADGTVNVSLEDASDGLNLNGMKMTATPDTVKAGRIVIHAINESRVLVHEVIVVHPPTNGAALPYDDKQDVVVEKQIKNLGEVSDLPSGRTGSLTVRLTPGDYLLICNQPNHYKAGMWTKLVVTR